MESLLLSDLYSEKSQNIEISFLIEGTTQQSINVNEISKSLQYSETDDCQCHNQFICICLNCVRQMCQDCGIFHDKNHSLIKIEKLQKALSKYSQQGIMLLKQLCDSIICCDKDLQNIPELDSKNFMNIIDNTINNIKKEWYFIDQTYPTLRTQQYGQHDLIRVLKYTDLQTQTEQLCTEKMLCFAKKAHQVLGQFYTNQGLFSSTQPMSLQIFTKLMSWYVNYIQKNIILKCNYHINDIYSSSQKHYNSYILSKYPFENDNTIVSNDQSFYKYFHFDDLDDVKVYQLLGQDYKSLRDDQFVIKIGSLCQPLFLMHKDTKIMFPIIQNTCCCKKVFLKGIDFSRKYIYLVKVKCICDGHFILRVDLQYFIKT